MGSKEEDLNRINNSITNDWDCWPIKWIPYGLKRRILK